MTRTCISWCRGDKVVCLMNWPCFNVLNKFQMFSELYGSSWPWLVPNWRYYFFAPQDPEGKPKKATIRDNQDGTYTVSYVPDMTGRYTILIKYGGDEIPYSPYRIRALPTGDASKCTVTGESAQCGFWDIGGWASYAETMPHPPTQTAFAGHIRPHCSPTVGRGTLCCVCSCFIIVHCSVWFLSHSDYPCSLPFHLSVDWRSWAR